MRFLLLLALALAACGRTPEPTPPDAGAPPPPLPAPAAALEQLRGGVMVFPKAGGALPAREGHPLFPGDAVETQEEGRAVLRFAGGRVVELEPQGRFELDEQGGGAELTVARGLVLTRRPMAPAGPALTLVISTPFGLTRVGDGQARVAVHGVGAEVQVEVGELELVPREGPSRVVKAGASAVLGAPRELPTIHLVLAGGGGQAEVRGAGARAWAPLTARRPALQPGDRVRVVRGQVTLAPEGSSTRLALLAGAEVALGPSARGAGQEATDLALDRGGLELATPAGQATRLGLGSGLTLEAEAPGAFSIRRQGEQLEVRSRAGDAVLRSDGGVPLALPGGGLATAGPGGLRLGTAPRELLQLPSRPGLEVAPGRLGRAALTWEAAGDGPYEVVVSASPGLDPPLLQGRVHEPFVSVPVPAAGTLHWSVRRGEEEVARGSARFGPERAGAGDLRRPRNQVPDGPETTTIYFQDKPPVVTFTWATFPGAARYRLQVYREGELQAPLLERTAQELALALPEGSLAEGRYRWSLTPLDAAGSPLQGGRLNRLELVYDNAVPRLVVRSPQEGQQLAEATVRVSGVAPLGAQVFANGRALALDAQARFDEPVAPLPGGLVVFRTVGPGGEAYLVRTVRR